MATVVQRCSDRRLLVGAGKPNKKAKPPKKAKPEKGRREKERRPRGAIAGRTYLRLYVVDAWDETMQEAIGGGVPLTDDITGYDPADLPLLASEALADSAEARAFVEDAARVGGAGECLVLNEKGRRVGRRIPVAALARGAA